MGLVHCPGPDQPKPNPVCSDIALQPADAVASELGDIAGRFFKVVEAGKIEASELGSFAAMKPTNLQPGSLEHALLKDVLLVVNDPSGLTAQMRRTTLRILLEITHPSAAVPRADQL